MKKILALALGLAIGYWYGRLSMLWVEIDEYHAIRMECKDIIDDIQELKR